MDELTNTLIETKYINLWMYNFGFLTSVDVDFCCWRLNRKWIENDNSIASNRIWISEAHFGIPNNMKCKNTAVDFCLKSWTVKRIVDCKFISIDLSDMVLWHELMRINVGFSFILIGIPKWASEIQILFDAIELSFLIHFRFNLQQQKLTSTEVRKFKIIHS